ncbi:MAG: DUF378 domain-containing protein [Candidatus Saccharimonadales bacterium]
MNTLNKVVYVLLIVGGLNWGMVGMFDINVIGNIFSQDLSRLIYSFVGVAALVGVYKLASAKPHASLAKKK